VVRRVNQDAFGRYDDPDRGEILLVVADGLGGHRGGEVASQMATQQLGPLVCAGKAAGGPHGSSHGISHGNALAAERLTWAIEQTNRLIYEEARRDYTLEGMGTTVACLLLAHEGPSWVAHVGDSRLYRLRAGHFDLLTEDHSLVATLVREGILTPEQARVDSRKNQILRALGVRKEVEVDVAPIEVLPGDTFLLCSDGLHGLVEDPEIGRLVREAGSPESAVAKLIEAANQAGGTDNVTCMLARFPERTRRRALSQNVRRVLASARSWWRPRGPE
jgi:protein phosphatase